MTPRALILGFAAVIFICGVTYFNNHVLKQTFLIGNHLPLIVFGGLVLFLITVNPLLGRIGKGVSLNAKELTVILAMSLAVSVIPSSGFLRGFAAMIILPQQLEKTEPGWSESGIVEIVPDVMLADTSEATGNPDTIVGFISGLATGDSFISLGDIPWEGLDRTLAFWLPLVLLLWVGLTGLSLVFHQQWSRYEHLPYPIAKITDSLLPDAGSAISSLLRTRGFLVTAGIVMTVHLINYAYTQDVFVIEINRQFNLTGFTASLPEEWRGKFNLPLNFQLYLTVVGVAYFLAREVSFSLGISSLVYGFVFAIFKEYGSSLEGGGIYEPRRHLMYGSYFGLVLSIFYTGRFFYKNVLLRALGFKGNEEPEPYTIWGMRVFLISMLGFITAISFLGLDWQLSVFFTAALLIIFIGMSRVVAETGLFWIQPLLSPAALLLSIMGSQALGPEMVLIMALLGMIFIADPREAFIPYIANALKIVENRGVSLGKTSIVCVLALVVGLAVAVPVTFFWQYNGGSQNTDHYAWDIMSRSAFKDAKQVQDRLVSQGVLEQSQEISGFERFAAMSPNWESLSAFLAGTGLVLLFSFMRLRFTRWPFHPVIFVVWTTWAMTIFAMCFLLGWIIKVIVSKYGGDGAHEQVKPIMIGLIAGELLGAIIPVIISVLYYFLTGVNPDPFNVYHP